MDYQSMCDLYTEEKIFDTLEVKIKVGVTTYDSFKAYLVSGVQIENDAEPTSQIFNKIRKKIINSINKMTVTDKHSVSHVSWSAFYTFKEMFDLLEKNIPEDYSLFYRGQGGGWQISPTLYRKGDQGGYSDEFRKNYDKIYKSIAQKFPEDLSYCAEVGSDERATNLAELQHYGLGTPLVDVTENPFIAMLFMTMGYNSDVDNPNPQMDVFYIKDDETSSIFQNVTHLHQNTRITAQKGAFLNFEKLDESVLAGNKKISRICIKIEYQDLQITNVEDLSEPNEPALTVEELNKNEKIALETSVMDIASKLNSYHYSGSDLFPDFYKYLEGVKMKYADKDHTKQQWNTKFKVEKVS